MKHEKIFRLDDGSRVKVIASLDSSSILGDLEWDFFALTCGKGKRTWTSPVDTNQHSYREKTMKERRDFARSKYSELVTKEMVEETANELWNKLKPSFAFGHLLKSE